MKKTSFLKEAIGSMKTTGTIRPSSRRLISKITRHVNFDRAKVIVELGAGEGCITRELCRRMGASSRLISFEINEKFYNHCVETFAADDRVDMISRSAFDLVTILDEMSIGRVDHVVSSLPLALFDGEATASLLGDIRGRLADDGSYIQYQYSLGSYRLIKDTFDHVGVSFTMRNLPPAFIYHCPV